MAVRKTVGSTVRISRAFKEIPFSVDSALLQELGERLVGRAPIALAELVKNSYDADATDCIIKLTRDRLEVTDNGDGLSAEEFVAHWMRIGTTHKRRRANTAKFHRPITGSKGIGRLAVQFLGSRLELFTRSRDGGDTIEAKVDWSDAVKTGELVHTGVLVRRLDDPMIFAAGSPHGMKIIIGGLRQSWNEAAVRVLARDIWMLQPPLEDTPFGEFEDRQQFAIRFETDDPDIEQEFKKQFRSVLDSYDARIDGEIRNGRRSRRCTVKVRFADGGHYQETLPLTDQSLDSAKFRILVFNLRGRLRHGVRVQDARDYFEKFGGVHVVDAGFRLPYYGIEQDWLQIEVDHARRMGFSELLPEELQVPLGMRELPSTRRLFGRVAVNTGDEFKRAPQKKGGGRSPYLQIQVTRDRLVDNEAYQVLKATVRASIDFYAMCVRRRRIREIDQQLASFGHTDRAVTGLRSLLTKYEASIPVPVLATLQEHVDALEKAEDIANQRALKERILLGSLATAGIAAVAIEHEVSKQLVALEELLATLYDSADGAPSPELTLRIDELRQWIDRVRETRQLFSPLMNESDREVQQRYRAHKVVRLIVSHAKFVLRHIDVNCSDIADELFLPESTMAAWYAVFQNILINSANAMLDSEQKRIHISGSNDDAEGWIKVQDTGVGVELADSDQLFEPFVRRLQISEERRQLGLGGTGLGLTIVRMIAESAGCTVQFVSPDAEFLTCIRISWPIKKH